MLCVLLLLSAEACEALLVALLESASRGRGLLGDADCDCVRRLRLRVRAAFAIALACGVTISVACDFELRSSTALSSLRAGRHCVTAPATCPCGGRGVPGGVSVSRACPGDLPFCVGRVVSAGFGPYGTLGRVRAAFAPGLDPETGRPLLRGAATLNGSPNPMGTSSSVPLLGTRLV